MRKFTKAIGSLFAASLTVSAFAEVELPTEPLSLSEALDYAGKSNHLVRQKELDVEAARVNFEHFESSGDLQLEATVVPQASNRSAVAGDNYADDSYLKLELTYPLYDFGLSEASWELARANTTRAERSLEHQRQLHRFEIMQKYFNVLLADLDYAVKNEKMTLAFLRYNRLLEEMEMYEAHAEVDVLALETIYREKFHVRQTAAMNQISARRKLGQTLGFSDYIPRDLDVPDVSRYIERTIPEYEDFLVEVSGNSFEIADAEMKLQSARNALKVTEKQYAPKLEAVVEAAAWKMNTGSRNDSSVGLQFRIPLIAGNSKSRALKHSGIAVERALSELNAVNSQFRTRVFDLWKKLKLLEVELAAANVRSDFRDQYMDRSRALYELEEKSDLGDAQSEQLFSFYELRRIEYEIALVWAEVDMMKGIEVSLP